MTQSLCKAGVFVAAVACVVVLHGCGGGGGDPTPSPTPAPTPGSPAPTSTPTASGGPHCKTAGSDGKCSECDDGYTITGADKLCLYSCSSDLSLGPIKKTAQKGLMMDDTTQHWCSDSLHSTWANTKDPVSSFRITKAWQADWPADSKEAAWKNIADFAKASGAKALVGTSLSCNSTNDDNDWKDVMGLLKMLGPSAVMGVAIGNEMELLWNQGASKECLTNLWTNQYVSKTFDNRVADLDAMGTDWKSVKVTSVFGSYIFAGQPFVDNDNAKVLTFLKAAAEKYKDRYAFSLNVYPYFDTSNQLDPGSKDQCETAIKLSTCFDSLSCRFVNMCKDMRARMAVAAGGTANQLWITETGWSSPKASTLNWDPAKFAMANCSKFSAMSTMKEYYDNFLKWDLTIPSAVGPDHVFYFGMRDSSNFGVLEHFGLGGSGDPTKLCVNTTCKLAAASAGDMTDRMEVV